MAYHIQVRKMKTNSWPGPSSLNQLLNSSKIKFVVSINRWVPIKRQSIF